MRAFPIMAVAGVVALLALLTYGVIGKDAGGAGPALGAPVPDRALPRLRGEGTGRIADYRGHWVLVNFWASWCDPCRAESPALQRFYERHRGKGFVVLGIDSQDLSGDAKEFVREFGLTYPMLRDGDGERSRAFKMTGFPESFLVDPRGRLALQRRGPVDGAWLRRQVEPFLGRR